MGSIYLDDTGIHIFMVNKSFASFKSPMRSWQTFGWLVPFRSKSNSSCTLRFSYASIRTRTGEIWISSTKRLSKRNKLESHEVTGPQNFDSAWLLCKNCVKGISYISWDAWKEWTRWWWPSLCANQRHLFWSRDLDGEFQKKYAPWKAFSKWSAGNPWKRCRKNWFWHL